MTYDLATGKMEFRMEMEDMVREGKETNKE